MDDHEGFRVALLTGAADKPYAVGLASALVEHGLSLDFIGSDHVGSPELERHPRVNFLNLRGDQSPNASVLRKILRVLRYYVRLAEYAWSAEPRLFHILWNNKVELLDRLLLIYYRLLGKRVFFTAHNVNAGERDGNDSWLNRFSLRCQYRLLDGIFVHTAKMKEELIHAFNVPKSKIAVIPFGVNTTLPATGVTQTAARKRLGVERHRRTLLFFGNIAPYKGIERLIEALGALVENDPSYLLIIAGKVKDCDDYWRAVQGDIDRFGIRRHLLEHARHIPDEEVELYFSAADVLVLPYTHIFQSGVLFLAYGFGLPVIAADVGSLREDVEEGRTGFVFRARDSVDLAATIDRYFQSPLYGDLETRRRDIREYAEQRYSWREVASLTCTAYRGVSASDHSRQCVKSVREGK